MQSLMRHNFALRHRVSESRDFNSNVHKLLDNSKTAKFELLHSSSNLAALKTSMPVTFSTEVMAEIKFVSLQQARVIELAEINIVSFPVHLELSLVCFESLYLSSQTL